MIAVWERVGTIDGRSTRVDRRVVFKITSGSKQTRLDKLLFLLVRLRQDLSEKLDI